MKADKFVCFPEILSMMMGSIAHCLQLFGTLSNEICWLLPVEFFCSSFCYLCLCSFCSAGLVGDVIAAVSATISIPQKVWQIASNLMSKL